MATKNNPGAYDCHANAEPDEPLFTLLARDPQAPDLVRAWALARRFKGEEPGVVEEAFQCAEAMEMWRKTNRPLKGPAEPMLQNIMATAAALCWRHDEVAKRISELLAANNRLIDERRTRDQRIAELEAQIAGKGAAGG